jgi:hypothetical protein
MKKILQLAAFLLISKCTLSQTLSPSLHEIYDPSINYKINPASSVSDENGNTFISTKINFTNSGIMKVGQEGNIIWQKILPYYYTENQVSYQNSFDSKNITYKPTDGVYLATTQNTGGMWGGGDVQFYLSKSDATNGSFYWHISCKAAYHSENKSMVLDAPNGVYWIFSNKIILISQNGVKLFSKTFSPDITIVSATTQTLSKYL